MNKQIKGDCNPTLNLGCHCAVPVVTPTHHRFGRSIRKGTFFRLTDCPRCVNLSVVTQPECCIIDRLSFQNSRNSGKGCMDGGAGAPGGRSYDSLFSWTWLCCDHTELSWALFPKTQNANFL